MRRTKEDAEKTRELILKTAADLFSEKGVARTTLLDIARAAHLTRGAIYWHFQNKLEIFDALYERLHQPFIQMILEDMNEDHPEPLGQLRDLCIKLFLDLRDNREKRQMIKLFLIKCDYEGELAPYKKKHRAQKKEGLALFNRYFDRARARGILMGSVPSDLLTLSLNCYMKGILFEYLDDPDTFDMTLMAPRLMTQFFDGLHV